MVILPMQRVLTVEVLSVMTAVVPGCRGSRAHYLEADAAGALFTLD
jgi:hypothetical protein